MAPHLSEVDQVFTLDEVAAITHTSPRRLKDQCRAGLVEHFRDGRFRGMTARQIDKYVSGKSGGHADTPVQPAGEFAAVREATRRSGARRGRRAA